MAEVKKLARSYCRQYLKGAPTAEGVKDALKKQGYTLVRFRSAYNDAPTAAIIGALKLQESIRSSKGFAYADRQYRLVFLHEDLSDEEALVILLHEQGHISCGHMNANPILGQDVLQENEANEFVHYVLHPGALTRTGNVIAAHKWILLAILALLACVGIGFGVWAALSQNDNDTFYVTASGGKYHVESCVHIKNKDNITQMTRTQLENAGYSPCETCQPNR